MYIHIQDDSGGKVNNLRVYVTFFQTYLTHFLTTSVFGGESRGGRGRRGGAEQEEEKKKKEKEVMTSGVMLVYSYTG